MQNINDLLQNQYENEEEVADLLFTNDTAPTVDEVVNNLESETEDEELVAEEPVSGTEPEIKPEITSETKSETEPDSPHSQANEGQISASKFLVVKDIIENIKNELSKIGEILGVSVSEKELEEVSRKLTTNKTLRAKDESSQMRVVEGVFDGQNMIGGDGEHYSVPANYASKSKLVEGDLLKLTILQDGSFVYKQIAPIERRRVVGVLAYDEVSDQYYVLAEGKRWKVLRASITYYKGEPGDEVTIVIPKDAPSQWAAVENIIKNKS